MLRRLVDFLYGSEPATFVSDLPVEQAVSRLRAGTARSAFHALLRERAAGKVTAHKVSLQRAIPFVGNSFKPFFVGQFRIAEGKTELRGVFTMHWYVKVFMSFWFGFCVLWTLLAMAAVATKPTELWFFPFAGIGMLLAGTALVAVGKWFARNDRSFISTVITEALGTSVA